jgi:hypothetical protein
MDVRHSRRSRKFQQIRTSARMNVTRYVELSEVKGHVSLAGNGRVDCGTTVPPFNPNELKL